MGRPFRVPGSPLPAQTHLRPVGKARATTASGIPQQQGKRLAQKAAHTLQPARLDLVSQLTAGKWHMNLIGEIVNTKKAGYFLKSRR